MDRLRVTGLDVSALIGIRDWEQLVRQRLVIDLVLDTDAARVAATDDIAAALDYSAIAHSVVDFVTSTRFRLIETLAERIAMHLLNEFPIERLSVIVHKPGAVPGALDTCIEIQRKRGSELL